VSDAAMTSTAAVAASRDRAAVIPAWWPADPRLPFAALLTLYAIVGSTVLGFNRSPVQIALTIVVGCALDVGLHWLFRGRTLMLPLSAYISMLSIAIILNYAHNYYLLFLPAFFAIASKYLFTFRGRHVFNPSLFGIASALLIGGGLYSTSPAYQWGGSPAVATFIVTAAVFLFVFRIGRTPLIVSFLVFYGLQVWLRAYILRWHVEPEVIVVGALTAPTFYLFAFYMMTDPKTSPSGTLAQVAQAFVVVVLDLVLHKWQSLYTLVYALFILSTARLIFLHGRALVQEGSAHLRTACTRTYARQVAIVLLIALAGRGVYATVIHPRLDIANPGFTLVEVPESITGIHSEMSDIMAHADPRLHHFTKWIMSVGDAVAVGDYDNDGRPDLFITNPLTRPGDRNALYRNLGGFRFERVQVPALDELSNNPRALGFSGGALFVDYDNSGAQSLFLMGAYGRSRLLKNMLPVTGRAEFVDVSERVGLVEHNTSVAATFFDADRDGRLDLYVANSLTPYLPDYPRPTPLTVFKLPEPEYPGDRRMFHFMHESWNDASNGGLNLLFRNDGTRFTRVPGMPEMHFSLAVGTGDLNGDGYTDLYVANDFGPDDLYLNDRGRRFVRVSGTTFGSIGKDTYKGMNASIADLDNRGELDVYVSNVHVPLQAEGSLLWKTYRRDGSFVPDIRDEATDRGVLNEGGFGWGAAVGDLNLDGWLDIVQANGMVDTSMDLDRPARPRDYWYAAEKVMLSPPWEHSYVDRWPDLRGYEIFGRQRSKVYISRGAETRIQYVDVAEAVGLTRVGISRGVALADFDNRGVLDVAMTHQFAPFTLYRNTLGDGQPSRPGRHWIGLAIAGDGARVSTEAIGTKVYLRCATAQCPQQMREVQIANGFSAQNDKRLLFGLADYDGVVDVEVHWYGAEKRVYRGLRTGRYYTIRYGADVVTQ
jgi:hypothetical protein